MRVAPVAESDPGRRPGLTRERVLSAAIELADQEGIEAVSMRRLASELGVEAMSLYTHVRSKDDLLDGMVDALIATIPAAREPRRVGWKAALRRLVMGARAELLRHPWAPPVIESRTTAGPAVPRYFDVVIGILRDGGFSVEQAHHALHILGSRALGFTQDLFDDSDEVDPAAAEAFAAQVGETMPYVAEMALAATHSGQLGACDDDVEFAFALDFILDGLDRLLKR
jgi:AcrR family transcriptional regulator